MVYTLHSGSITFLLQFYFNKINYFYNGLATSLKTANPSLTQTCAIVLCNMSVNYKHGSIPELYHQQKRFPSRWKTFLSQCHFLTEGFFGSRSYLS